MVEEIVMLSHFLRNEGVFVSIRSTTLACIVFESMRNVMTTEELQNSLEAIYVKDVGDHIKFEKAFKKVFSKIELKQEKTEFDKADITNMEGIRDLTQQSTSPIQNLEQLQELYDEMMNYRTEIEAKEGKVIDGSLLLIDNFDPKVFELCRKLSRKIANKRSSRRKKSNSHILDMSRTIRANIKNGGHCIKLVYAKPPMKKTKHIFLCDVSGSCEWVTTWFFILLYGCASTFNKVRIYDFDNKITDITDLLNTESFSSAGQVNVAQRSKGISCFGQSDMAKSFKEFLDTADINKRTDIIIMTDCRDWKGKRISGVLESALLIKEMLKIAHRVIILNPEKKIRWNNATSYVSEYEKMGAEVFEVSSLEKFEKIISEL